MDNQRRRAVGAGLERDHEQHKGREEPVACDEKSEETESDDDRNHQAPCERRSDPRHVLLSRRAIVGEPPVELLIGRFEPADRKDELDQREPEQNHQPDEQRVTAEQGDEEDPDWVFRPDAVRKPFGEAALTWLEDRHSRVSLAPAGPPLVLLRESGRRARQLRCCIDRHAESVYPREASGKHDRVVARS